MGEKCTIARTIEDKDIYRIALDTRNLEISLFWQRSNYFLVLNSGLALAYFSIQNVWISLAVAIFGLLSALLWYRTNLGSKFWQSRWEQRLAEIERRIAPDLKMFAADYQSIEEDVRQSQNLRGSKTIFHRWLQRQILRKPSVSAGMTALSMLFVSAWVVLPILRFIVT